MVRLALLSAAGCLIAGSPTAGFAQVASVRPQQAAAARAPAAALVASGVAKAKADHKLVLAIFGGPSCGWCVVFDRFLGDTAAGAARTMHDTFVVVHLVVYESEMSGLDTPGSEKLIDAYSRTPGVGIPFYAILDSAGKELGNSMAMPDGSNIGHPANEKEFEAFDRLLARVAPRVTAEKRDEIRAYLRKMAEKK